MKLGFIGFGEAAFHMAVGLKSQGIGNIFAFDSQFEHPTYGRLIQQRADESGVELMSLAALVPNVEILIVAVPADKAIEVSKNLRPHLLKNCLYVDVSAATPSVKCEVWNQLKESEVAYVDAAMMGPLPVYKHKVPILASGNGTDWLIQAMTPFGMDIQKVSSNPGDASAVKLIRSIFMKGMAALSIEMLQAARAFKVEDLVLSSVLETMEKESFEATINRLVTGTAIHALRRSIELDGSIQMLEQANISPLMSRATKQKHEWLAELNLKDKFLGEAPSTWSTVISACQN